jgi:hypothetical protein
LNNTCGRILSANSRSLKIYFTSFRKSSGGCGNPLATIAGQPKTKSMKTRAEEKENKAHEAISN